MIFLKILETSIFFIFTVLVKKLQGTYLSHRRSIKCAISQSTEHIFHLSVQSLKIHSMHERLLPFYRSFACNFPGIQIAGVCLTYQPQHYESVFSDFNMTTCKHLEVGPTESLETIKVAIDSSCISDAQLYVSVKVVLLPIVFKKICSLRGIQNWTFSGYRLRSSNSQQHILG